MPYQWIPSRDAPTALHLWPYRSLPRKGMVWFIGATAALIALPLLVLLGSPVLWGMLPFLMAAIAAIYWALNRSYRDGEVLEVLELSAQTLSLTRHGPHKRYAEWQANPHWVKVNLHAVGGPVPQYLTLQGSGREVELGAFLTEEERKTLDYELRGALRLLQ
jgi:uncharacterized membrane protein